MNRLSKSLFTFLVLMTSLNPEIGLAFFNPSLNNMGACFKETSLSGEELFSISVYPDLYINEFDDNSDSVDAALYKRYNLVGLVVPGEILKRSWKVLLSHNLLLTGNMYFRKASIFEKFIGGGSDKYFYEVIINSKRYLLLSSYIVLPIKNRCHNTS